MFMCMCVGVFVWRYLLGPIRVLGMRAHELEGILLLETGLN